MMEYTLIPMELRHVAQVVALEKVCFSDPWSEKSVRSELDNPLSLWLVAEAAEGVVGYIGSQSVLGESDMMNVAVAPQARRQGIARALVTELVRRLRELGNDQLTLEVRVSNDGAQRLYHTLGFSEVGRRKNYYVNPKEDALILRLSWGGEAVW